MKKSLFARVTALVLAMLMVASLAAGCGKQPSAGNQESGNQLQTPPQADETQAVTDETQAPANESQVPKDDAHTAVDEPSVQTPGPVQTGAQTPAQPQKPAQENNQPVQLPSVGDAPVQIPAENTPAQTPDQGSSAEPTGKYNAGIVLIKSKTAPDASLLRQHGITSAEPLFTGSKWYCAQLTDPAKTVETVKALRQLEQFEDVDYDYVMESDASAFDMTTNPDFEKAKHFGPHGIQQGWTHINDHDRHPGGSKDVIIAVIDTGVDYTHIDLRDNIWVNTAEIPGNGIDDDGNGYIDDVNGWNCVGDNNDPADDNGHGTHVAGIIAASNNNVGGVGVAYNCTIMPIKAGNSSGYFNSSDIAEAVQYAYMNGASVINMSFGGGSISIPTMDVMEDAYTACVLVAAAGNDGLCNNLDHVTKHDVGITYPAALPYVIGVMSTSTDGATVSGFSNYDDTPFDSVEYEVYAVGEAMPSTWPGNKYATLQGTSMATPTVSGIAALLRSYYSDRDSYPTKFIQSQIVNTGTLHPFNYAIKETDKAHSIANIYEALTKLPKPAVSLYDYYIDDSASISSANNGDGVMDAGETVRLYISLHNRGGVASNVHVTIDANRGEGISDPYFTFPVSAMALPDIGTYSVMESGDQYFEILVAKSCPNEYLTNFNIHYTYENGLDAEDTTVYTDDGMQQAQFDIRSGVVLKGQITEDTVLTKDNYYIIPTSLYIAEGVTVTVEPGTKLQFWSSNAKDEYAETGIAVLTVAGRFITQGTAEEPVELFPSDHMGKYRVEINYAYPTPGYIELNYTHITNPHVHADKIDHCTFSQNYYEPLYLRRLENGVVLTVYTAAELVCSTTVTNSVFYKMGCDVKYELKAPCDTCVFVDSSIHFYGPASVHYNSADGSYHYYSDDSAFYTNCVFVGNAAKTQDGSVSPSAMTIPKHLTNNGVSFFRNPETGTTYFKVSARGSLCKTTYAYYDTLAKTLGGHIAILETPEEAQYVISKGGYNACVDLCNGSNVWPNGIAVDGFTVTAGNREYPRLTYKGELDYSQNDTFILIEVPGSIYLDTLKLKETSVTIDDETIYQLQIDSVLPVTFDTSTLLYVSSDPSVLTVSEGGLVTPLRAGTAEIYVYSPDYITMATCQVTVAEKIPATAISLEDTTIATGNSLILKPAITPANTTEQVIYTSSDPAVASIQGSVLTAHKPGTATIAATIGNVSTTCQVRVVQSADAIAFADNFYLTWLEDTRTDWQPRTTPDNATDVVITYLSSNPEIAYVDESGVLIRVAPGNATIRASVAGTELFDEIVINVSETPVSPQVQVVQLVGYQNYRFAVLSDHTLWYWGKEITVPTKVADNVLSFGSKYGSGNNGLYAVTTDGALYQCGYCINDTIMELLDISGSPMLTNVQKIATNEYTLFAITNDGSVFAFGDNTYGQLGDGTATTPDSFIQTDITDVKNIVPLSCSTYFLCNGGELFVSGNTTQGNQLIPVKVMDGVTKIAADYWSDEIIAYTQSGVYTIYNGYTQSALYGNRNDERNYIYENAVYLYTGSSEKYSFPITEEFQATELFYYNSAVFIQTADGKLYGIGTNDHYQLGDSTSTNRTEPTRIFFGLKGDVNALTAESVNIQEDILMDPQIRLDFNTAIHSGSNYGSIKLTDSNGLPVGIRKSILLDKVTLAPYSPFKNGETYTLTIPAGAFVTAFGVVSREMVYTFTYLNNTPIAFVSGSLEPGAALTDPNFSTSFVYTIAKESSQFSQIAVLREAEPVSGITVTLENNTLTLSGTLDYGSYTLSIPADALADNVGGTNAELLIDFTVYKPTEYTCSIADGQIRADEREPITVTFTDTMTAAALDAITLTDAAGTPVALEVTLADTLLTIAHGGLAQGTQYILSIPAGAVTDSIGKGNNTITVRFGTYFPAALAYASVADGAEQLALAGGMKLYYNDNVYTLDENKLSLAGPEGDVAITVTREGEVVTVTPNAALAPSTVYTLTAAQGAMTDERGAVSAEYTASFTTVAVAERFFWTQEGYLAVYDQLMADGIGIFSGNAILNNLNDTNMEHWLRLTAAGGYAADATIGAAGNYWGTGNPAMVDRQIVDFDDYQNLADIVVGKYLTIAPENTFPFVTDAYLLDADGEVADKVSAGTYTFVVEFNRDMDTTQELDVAFGSVAPYADYQVTGHFVNARRWEGTYTIKGTIEGGVQKLNISDGRAADDHYLKLYDTVGRFEFEIDNTAALSMNLFAEAKIAGIELTWNQDDYDTLMGYNIYRSEDKDGNFVKINPTILLTTDASFLDTNAEPGKTYWYTFTVVLSDFTESAPAGKVTCTAMDTMAPSVYHTPVNQGYQNNNLVISCTASDNIAIAAVKLYYRTVGTESWKQLTMSKVNDKYSATIFGSDLSMAGLEYYIEASDGHNTITKGSAEAPYTVVIKDASAISHLGDVDGDGIITTKDALMIVQAINGDRILTDDQFQRANLNKDDKLSTAEALRILKYINGTVTSLEM